MKFKVFFALAFCLFAFVESNAQDDPFKMPPKVFPILKEKYVSATSDDVFTVGKVTGDIGAAKALYLPSPFYPGEAKQDSAEGKIYVQVAIDEKGNVASARSTDGHPALRKIAEETALVSKFRAAIVNNQPAKSEGWLIYNFEIARSNWIKLAYDLAFLHLPNNNQKLALAGVKKNIKPDWKAENEMLLQLGEYVAQTPKMEKSESVPTFQATGKNGAMQTFSVRLPSRPEPNPEQIAVTQNLLAALQSRLATDEIALWQFNLAFAILQEAYPPRDSQGTFNSPETLKIFLRNAPQNLSAEYKTELANLIKAIEAQGKQENFDKIQAAVIKLQKLK